MVVGVAALGRDRSTALSSRIIPKKTAIQCACPFGIARPRKSFHSKLLNLVTSSVKTQKQVTGKIHFQLCGQVDHIARSENEASFAFEYILGKGPDISRDHREALRVREGENAGLIDSSVGQHANIAPAEVESDVAVRDMSDFRADMF